ncbi:hypothetical protein ABZ372_55625, partial [Streptomyces sp. NPDC005921]
VRPARFVREHRITHWFSVPSVITYAQRLRDLGLPSDGDTGPGGGQRRHLEEGPSGEGVRHGLLVSGLFGISNIVR